MENFVDKKENARIAGKHHSALKLSDGESRVDSWEIIGLGGLGRLKEDMNWPGCAPACNSKSCLFYSSKLNRGTQNFKREALF